MGRRNVYRLALLLCALDAPAMGAYDCPPTCDVSPNCQCAYTAPPDELALADTPQFIVLTNDDAVSVTTYPVMLNITSRHTNRGGCPMPATWFVSITYTDPDLVRSLYMAGHEIATHTVDHVGQPNATEILGAKLWLNQTANVPLEKLRGFRTPFLAHNAQTRSELGPAGIVWDSSISEQFGPSSASPDAAHRVWPFTFDYGIPINCAIGSGTCSPDEVYPGLWEFEMWDVQDDAGQSIATMDPVGNFTELYMREFLRNYNGARTPLGIYLHAAWLLAHPEHAHELNVFLDWALAQDNVWVVLEWMKNPVPTSAYKLACPTPTDMWFPTGRYCAPPAGGCIQGRWSPSSCSCDCLNMWNASAVGFCPDAASGGACTLQKQFDAVSKTFVCPGAPTARPTEVLHPQATPDIGHAPMEFAGLSLSGADGDAAVQFAAAFQAVDNLTSTCASVPRAAGGYSYMSLALPAPTHIDNVSVLLADSTVTDLYVLAGGNGSASGVDGAVCAGPITVAARTSTTLACGTTTSIVTVRSSSPMHICDLAVNMAPTSPSSASREPVATILPVAGVEFEFAVSGTSMETFAAQGKADSVCAVLKLILTDRLGQQALVSCTIASSTERQSRRRLAGDQSVILVTAVIQTVLPSQVTQALQNAQADGTLATQLANLSLTLIGTDSPPASGGGSSSAVGAAVGGAVGGAALVGVVAAAVVAVRRRRLRQAGAKDHDHEQGLPVSTSAQAEGGERTKPKTSPDVKASPGISIAATVPGRSRLGQESAYSSDSPRLSAATTTPRWSTRRSTLGPQ
eukprot:scaffold5.g938.t1